MAAQSASPLMVARPLNLHLPGFGYRRIRRRGFNRRVHTALSRADTPEGKVVDYIQGVVVLAGKDVGRTSTCRARSTWIACTPEQQQQIAGEPGQPVAASRSGQQTASGVNADLEVVNRDLQDAENARAAAIESLGKAATRRTSMPKLRKSRMQSSPKLRLS